MVSYRIDLDCEGFPVCKGNTLPGNYDCRVVARYALLKSAVLMMTLLLESLENS